MTVVAVHDPIADAIIATVLHEEYMGMSQDRSSDVQASQVGVFTNVKSVHDQAGLKRQGLNSGVCRLL